MYYTSILLPEATTLPPPRRSQLQAGHVNSTYCVRDGPTTTKAATSTLRQCVDFLSHSRQEVMESSRKAFQRN